MKKAIIALLVLAILVMSVSVVMAKGPYKSLAHRKDGEHVLTDFAGDALDIKNKGGEKFVQWFNGKQYVCQCTDGMNPGAIASKQSDDWFLWTWIQSTDPRYNWCPETHLFICRNN